MKTLGNLSPAPGSNQAKKRLGRGVGSGLGKTAGRGHKGQKARKSSDVPAGFEGGQVPLYRRLPKRGFFNIFATPVEIVKLSSLQGIPAGTIVDVAELHKRGLISSKEAKVKLLNSGELKASLTLKVHSASKAAKSTVESAGGRLEIIEVPVKVDPRIAKKLAKKKKK